MAGRPPPLLLTKRLTSFLHLNLSAQITTLLLLNPDGKLLAYASNPPIPVATLRTHGTVAASLYAIHSSGTDRDTIDGALGPNRTDGAGGSGSNKNSKRPDRTTGHQRDGPLAVTIQLETGIVLVIRRLRCGMLFVCMGPPDPRLQAQPSQQQHSHAAHLGSPSDVASVLSAATAQTSASSVMFGAGTAGVMATRRHAEELARWLDDKLGSLELPADGLGGAV
ncbi:hypothetical protein M406DRAFT_347749 [Cryphonectria parasitica EP155]|uniref:Uncharacterized protein n=1 Tax=Cryphonectria parasitica (strain ATCC 38755 / EP155) TaxID=660469 RepID=A0A9P5CJQ7_CRYP1|nr:uncharacterized protein M406DRAFT_347749 [Cryphonectria parasitica EP155]KAF3761253.1 hypothetical protein M406DRAFT_347749 [Cryphonectria parasitica EP155]